MIFIYGKEQRGQAVLFSLFEEIFSFKIRAWSKVEQQKFKAIKTVS